MIISRAPLRISFLGGGTDTKEFIEKNDYGCVLGTTIDRYVHVFIDDQPSFEKSKYKFTYRKVEEVDIPSQFQHPIVREMLKDLQIYQPLNIATMANLPGRSGLGSSSSFTVALYAALLKRENRSATPHEIAKYSIFCERVLAHESGGYQDQFHAAFGGFRFYKFGETESHVSPILISEEVSNLLNQSMVLVATLERRESSDHARALQNSLQLKQIEQSALEMRNLCEDVARRIKERSNPENVLRILAEGMKEGWLMKKRQIAEVDIEVNDIIKKGISKGASAAKLCGAGGSGFVLFICDPESVNSVRNSFSQSQVVIPKVVNSGVSANEI